MLLASVRQYKNEKMPEANGLWFAYPVITETIDINGLAAHMASHNTPFSKGAIKGMLTDMVTCVKELASQGFAIKIDDLAIFSIGIKNKMGAKTEKEFSAAKNIEGFKLRARGTGEFKATNLDFTIKRLSSLTGDNTTTDDPNGDGPEPDSGNTPGSGTGDSGSGSGSGGSTGGGTTPTPPSGGDGTDEGDGEIDL